MTGFQPPRANSQRSPYGENIKVEPVLQSAGVNDGEKSVNQEEATCTPSNTQKGGSFSSQVAAANGTAKIKRGAVRNQRVLQNKTANTTSGENKFFDPGGEQDWCALPSRPLSLSGRA